jgi:hypothetical protein
MNKYLVITIDVEPDCSPSWKYSNPLSFNGVHEGIANRLQPLFNKYNITPTYLINNVVLEDAASCKTFSNLNGFFELGTHLHPEFIAPEKKFDDYRGKKGEANCCFYEPEIEFAKIENITRLFTGQFGIAPLSFRAGRFSAGLNTIKSLKKLSYKVDTSVTPNVIWNDRTRERPVDFRAASNQPYWIGDSSMVTGVNEHDLLEVPVSITRKKLSFSQIIKYILKNKQLPYRGSKAAWLRPVFSKYDQFINIIGDINEKQIGDTVVYNMMFHNVEIIPGLSPYSSTEEDARAYMGLLELFFQYCNANNIQSVRLSALYDIYKKQSIATSDNVIGKYATNANWRS